jgi:hypothetical protein
MSAVAVVGHPFSSIGMGEQARAGFAAIRAVGVEAKFYDVFRYAERTDPDFRFVVLPNESSDLNKHPVRIFHINGDEVDAVTEALAARGDEFQGGYNIIVPAWELPTYPAAWKAQLEAFDEIWAISYFVKAALEAAGLSSHHVGQAVEKSFPTLLGRKYFGIRESAFVILNFFDTQSFSSRKNPRAILELFRRIRKARPYDDIQLVLKMRAGDTATPEGNNVLGAEIPNEVRVITENLSSHETYSLISACDCFGSLHRAEGFGRGMAEAMWLGRLALATNWSGNCDYMEKTNSLLVDYNLIDIKSGEYLHADGQQWADPDIDHAEFLLRAAIDDPDYAASLRNQGRIAALSKCSNRAVGLRMLSRLTSASARGRQAARLK